MALTEGTTAPGGNASLSVGLTDVIGRLPYRVQLAGGWIDQPFISELNPEPPGSMVVVSLEPTVRFMDRCGMATGTRYIARDIWGDQFPDRSHDELIRELYAAENKDLAQPSGSQDMAGLIVPGVSRLDYEVSVHEGIFPSRIESTTDAASVEWLESVLRFVAVGPRPAGYDPLTVKRLDREWVRRLSRSGKDCYDAIVRRDLLGLGASMVECTLAWDALLPGIFAHPTISLDLKGLLASYQAVYPGAMYSGCGGGYIVIAAEGEVPGSFRVKVRA
jgi:hypothetical protein